MGTAGLVMIAYILCSEFTDELISSFYTCKECQ